MPVPDAEGIRKTQELFARRFDMDLTNEEEADILGQMMRFIYLTTPAKPEEPCIQPYPEEDGEGSE